MFAAAVAADSNRELDWLWLAEQVDDLDQRRFCYEKALSINPASQTARYALSALRARSAPQRELALGELWREA